MATTRSDQKGWALVTGATGGIGAEMSRQLARRGWSVALAGRSEEKLRALEAELNATGARTAILTADLADPSGAAALISAADEAGVEPEFLVNNAGLGLTAPYVQTPFERQRALIQVDVVSLAELCHAYGGRMAAHGHGRIMNIASVAGVMPGPYMSTYFASKAFVLSLSQALHDELRGCGVDVMALCPGPVRTGFWQVAGTDVSALGPLLLSPSEVCAIGLAALSLKRAACAPGLLSKACYGFGRAVPYLLSRKVAGLFNRG